MEFFNNWLQKYQLSKQARLKYCDNPVKYNINTTQRCSSHSLFYVLYFMPRKVSKLCAILAKIVTKFYNTAKKDVQWDFKLFNRVSHAVRILIENVLHPPILKAGICSQAQNAGKPHHLWQKEVGLERRSWYMLKNLAKTFFLPSN